MARLFCGLVLASLAFGLVAFALDHAGLLVVLAAGAGCYALARRRTGA